MKFAALSLILLSPAVCLRAADSPPAPSSLEKAMGSAQSLMGGGSVNGLSTETIVAGLKGGLSAGVDRAVAELGKPDGFLKNAGFKIPLPSQLAKLEKTARKLRQDRLADTLIAALNHAAEQAVAETAPVFKDALLAMKLDDAVAILKGPPDAATAYFRRVGETALRGRMMPIVKTATDANGVGAAYKQFAEKASPFSALLGAKPVDLDGYVCDRALDSLFKLIATEEAALRADPKATASKLVSKVFSAAAR
jgi:hypothetical protein